MTPPEEIEGTCIRRSQCVSLVTAWQNIDANEILNQKYSGFRVYSI